MTDSLLLSTTRVRTFIGQRLLTAASGFLFEEGGQFYLVTSRHVLYDLATDHLPDQIEIELHTDRRDMTRMLTIPRPLYSEGRALWRQGNDSGGDIDVAVLPLDAGELPAGESWFAFSRQHLVADFDSVPIGQRLLIVGYPLGFHDTLHRLPVARRASVASAYGVRFQGQGCFLTDARTHRGSSGAPVVMHDPDGDPALPWKLLGVHSSRMDMLSRDLVQDESLGLNMAWYADIIPVLLAPVEPTQPAQAVQPADPMEEQP